MTTERTSDTTHGIAPPGFRLPAATSVGMVRLQVSDLARSTAYYEQVLGLRAGPPREGRVDLTAAGDRQVLVRLEQGRAAGAARRDSTLGLYHFAIRVPDRATLGRLLAHLSAIGLRAGMSDHLVSEAIYLTDPDGLGIEVYADRPRSDWRYSGRQLVMATEPLRTREVIAAGAGAPWSGMPPGTVMGHVHLHVGDLVAAEAFYHAALGFDKVVWGYPGALFLSAGGYHHHLGTNTWSAGPPAAADQPRLLSWDLVVPDPSAARAAAASLAASGHPVTERDGAWSAADPWGTEVRLVTNGDSSIGD